MLKNHNAESAALRKDADVPSRRLHRGEGGVEAHRRLRVGHAHAVGAHQPHPAASRELADSYFGLLSGSIYFTKARTDYDNGMNAGARIVLSLARQQQPVSR